MFQLETGDKHVVMVNVYKIFITSLNSLLRYYLARGNGDHNIGIPWENHITSFHFASKHTHTVKVHWNTKKVTNSKLYVLTEYAFKIVIKKSYETSKSAKMCSKEFRIFIQVVTSRIFMLTQHTTRSTRKTGAYGSESWVNK